VYIAHCVLHDFSFHRSWRRHALFQKYFKAESPGYFEALRPLEERLADHYRLPFVSTCAAFHTMLGGVDQSDRVTLASEGALAKLLRRLLPQWMVAALETRRHDALGAWDAAAARCTDAPGGGLRSVTDVQPPFYATGDPTHFSPTGSALQACLATHALLTAPLPLPPVPPAWLPDARALDAKAQKTMCGAAGEGQHCLEDDTDVPTFCQTTREGQLRAANGSSGWEERTGGRGGNKRWLAAARVGATLRLEASQPATAFKLEVYRHHTLGLGRVAVRVAGLAEPTLIDGCCPAPGCPGIPLGQGTYATVRVPAEGHLPAPASALEVVTVARRPGERTYCTKEGAAFSITGLVGIQHV
jgi:hypothetical protein